MRTLFGSWDIRRVAPRLALDALCSEVVDGKSRLGFAVDLSPTGVRLERPYRPGMPRPREVELELALPGEDDVVMAEARVRFDEVRPAPRGSALAAAGGLVRVTGLLLSCFGIRDRRLLLDYVMDRRPPEGLPAPALAYVDDDLRFASCYARG